MFERETDWDENQVEFELFALSLGWHVPLAAHGQFPSQAGTSGETGQAKGPLAGKGQRGISSGSWNADMGQMKKRPRLKGLMG